MTIFYIWAGIGFLFYIWYGKRFRDFSFRTGFTSIVLWPMVVWYMYKTFKRCAVFTNGKFDFQRTKRNLERFGGKQ